MGGGGRGGLAGVGGRGGVQFTQRKILFTTGAQVPRPASPGTDAPNPLPPDGDAIVYKAQGAHGRLFLKSNDTPGCAPPKYSNTAEDRVANAPSRHKGATGCKRAKTFPG